MCVFQLKLKKKEKKKDLHTWKNKSLLKYQYFNFEERVESERFYIYIVRLFDFSFPLKKVQGGGIPARSITGTVKIVNKQLPRINKGT